MEIIPVSNSLGKFDIILSSEDLEDIKSLNIDWTIYISKIHLPVLYKERSAGGWQSSSIFIYSTSGPLNLESGDIVISVEHGKVGGKMQKSNKDILDFKSQHSLVEQAIFNARSDWRGKIDSGYSLTVISKEDSDFLPMLAKKWVNMFKHLSSYFKSGRVLWAQAKLDGIRGNLLFNNTGNAIIQSRKGKDNSKGLEHITDAFKMHFAQYNVILDGEIYNHGMSLQEISGDARRFDKSSHLKFVVYDIYHIDNPKLKYSERFFESEAYKKILELECDIPIVSIDSLFKTEKFYKDPQEEILDINTKIVDAGFEGVIIRVDDLPYEINKRSSSLVKYKTCFDDEYEIVGVTTPETGSMAGQAIFVCGYINPVTNKKDTFEVTPMGETEIREEYYRNRNKIIGKLLTVKYYGFTDDGKPSHANGVCIRDYE